MDFGILMIPLATAIMAFGFAVMTDTEKIHFEPIDVPLNVIRTNGYSSEVIIKKIADGMHRIEVEADSRARAHQVELHQERVATHAASNFIGLTPLVRAVQASVAMIPFTFSGELVVSDKDVIFTLRGYDAYLNQRIIEQQGKVDRIPQLLTAVSYEAMRWVDPYILAAYQFKRDRLINDFSRTLAIIYREMGEEMAASPAGRAQHPHAKWMENLWGIVLYHQWDRDGAIEKFKASHARDPAFLSPLLNWGVVLARQGLHDEAIARFREVVESPAAAADPRSVAAAYSEWGFSLSLTGDFDGAFAKFHKAEATAPDFAEVYRDKAEVLSILGRKEEAKAMMAEAKKRAPQDRIDTENLIGAVQILPAPASIH